MKTSTHISAVKSASELFRVVSSDGHLAVLRGDLSRVVPIGPLDGPEVTAIISKIEGPFTKTSEAEDRVVTAIRDWQDRGRAAWYKR